MILGNKNKKTQTKIRYFKAILIGSLLGSSIPYVKDFFSDHYRINSRHKTTPRELKKYKDVVKMLSKNKLGKTDIKLGFRNNRPNLKYVIKMQNVIGSCNYIISDKKYEIDIYRDYWQVLSFEQKIFLVAHELKHCECRYFKHIDIKFFDDGCPFSYMNRILPSATCLNKRFDHYVSELQTGCS